MTVAPVIKRVPGKPVKFQHEKDGFVDLTSVSKIELLDLQERENKLLNNKRFIDKLPDKGEKIKNFRIRVEKELKRREEHDKLCTLLENLNVNESKEALNKLEWTGDSNLSASTIGNDTENETDPLKIFVSHSGTSVSKEKVFKTEESITLVKPTDVEDQLGDLDVDLYAKQLCHRFDKNTSTDQKKKFYPHKSLNKTFTKSTPSDKEPEISAAYTPKHISGQTKLISLEESLVVHQEQTKHLKEVEVRHALEKLMQKKDVKIKQPKNLTTSYRDPQGEDSDDEESYVTEESSEEEYDEEEKTSNLSDLD